MSDVKENPTGTKWTPEEDDSCLEHLLACTREEAIPTTKDKLCAALGRGDPANDPIGRRMWGLAVRNDGTRYKPSGQLRVARGGEKPTPFELVLLNAALASRAAGAVHGADEIFYLAELLNRPVKWTDKTLKDIDPRRQIKPFF